MGALKRIKHEKFAQVAARSINQTDAYREVYPLNTEAPECAASRLMTREEIKARIIELLQENQTTSPSGLVDRLGELVRSDNEGIALGAVNTSLKVVGAFETDVQNATINAIQIVFNDAKSPQSGDPTTTNGA